MKRNEIMENLVYAGIWFMLLLTPIISLLIRMSTDTDIQFSWNEVFDSWRMMVPFLLVFVLHNYLMARLLIYNHKTVLYLTLTLALLVIFQLYECQHRPSPMNEEARPQWTAAPAPPHAKDGRPLPQADGGPVLTHQGDMPPMPPADGEHPMPQTDGDNTLQGPPPPPHERGGQPAGMDKNHPPLMDHSGPVMPLLVMMLMLGLNLGIKSFFKSRLEAKKMEALQRAHLEQQLEYLKYQVNPHFFMNTLNNIHALVDIDPEQAKTTILELSKLMRYVLYEGAKDKVPLLREVGFLQNYVTLMRLRYTERVRIDMTVDPDLPDRKVPPMILITFVENAFKHGVSYRNASFIDIRLRHSEGRLYFDCINSRQDNEQTEHGGVGLRNVRERLQLLFGKDYTLQTDESADRYEVHLDFPTYD